VGHSKDIENYKLGRIRTKTNSLLQSMFSNMMQLNLPLAQLYRPFFDKRNGGGAKQHESETI